MKQPSQEAEQIMVERFGKDALIALATTENGGALRTTCQCLLRKRSILYYYLRAL